MTQKSLKSLPRRVGRVLMLVVFGYPQMMITIPLSIALLLAFIVTVRRHSSTAEVTPMEWLKSITVVTFLVLLTAMALFQLMTSIRNAWRQNGSDDPLTRRLGPGGRGLDAVVTRAYVLRRIEELARVRRVYGPVARCEPSCSPPVRYFYEPIEDVGRLTLDFSHAVYSPKAVLLPPRETLLQFDRTNGRFLAVPCVDVRPTALIGVHPCDVNAIRLLDEVFTRDHPDLHYQSRRRNTFIVGVDCPKPCKEGVFCRDIGAHQASDGFDVMLYPLVTSDNPSEALFGVSFGTDEGRRWLAEGKDAECEPADDDAVQRLEAYLSDKQRAFPRRLDLLWKEIPELLRRSYDSLLWQATAQRCYSCGSCNLVCPTCYCFDISDENDLPVTGGSRERTWDGCMLRDFALVAGGHNFRGQAAHRLRHRIYRKSAWIEQRTGMTGCVGCARCVQACTAHISIVEILNQLAHEKKPAHREPAAVGGRAVTTPVG